MRRRQTAGGLGATLGLALAACFGTADYRCADSVECRHDGVQGTCRADGYCSYPDADCPSGERYSDQAGSLASLCVDVEPPVGSTSSTSDDDTTEGGLPVDDDSTGAPTRTEAVCGNGVREGGEACDDANAVDGDGCNVDCAVSASPRWSPWDRVYGGAPESDAKFLDVDVRPDGTVIAVGSEALATGGAALFVLWSEDGDVVWARHYDVDAAADLARSVTAAVGSEIFVVGRTTTVDAETAWLLNVEPADGDVEDQAVTGQQFGSAIAYMHVGRLVVAGHGFGTTGVRTFDEQLTLEATAEVVGGGAAAVAADGVRDVAYYAGTIGGVPTVARADAAADPALVPLWEGDTAVGAGLQGLAFRDGVLVAAGYEGLGMRDAWLATIDTVGGGTGWTFTTREPGEEEIEDVAIDPTGAIVAVGFGTGSGQDARVYKLGPDGTLLWQWDNPLPNDDVARAVAVRPDGDIVVAGERTGPDGATDAWITRLTP